MSAKDTITIKDIWLAAVCTFLGYELLGLDDEDHKTEYLIGCPEEDFKIIEADYRSAQGLPLSSARDFVAAFNKITWQTRDMRRSGNSTYRSPEWVAGKG